MTVPSEKYSKTETIVCSNCGSHSVKETWVNKGHKQNRKEVGIDDKILEKQQAHPLIFIGDFIGIPIQYVLTCQECGYTAIQNIKGDS